MRIIIIDCYYYYYCCYYPYEISEDMEAQSGEDKAFLSVWLELGRGRDRRGEATGFDAETTSSGAGVRMPAQKEPETA